MTGRLKPIRKPLTPDPSPARGERRLRSKLDDPLRPKLQGLLAQLDHLRRVAAADVPPVGERLEARALGHDAVVEIDGASSSVRRTRLEKTSPGIFARSPRTEGPFQLARPLAPLAGEERGKGVKIQGVRVLATRNPSRGRRLPGGLSSRYAHRKLSGLSLLHEPPRNTRDAPESGPTGSFVGDFA